MSTLDSILGLLSKWGPWKRIQESPERIDELEKRVEALEKKLARCPGEACPKCGELTHRVISTRIVSAHPGFHDRRYKCESCTFEEFRREKG